MADFTLFDDRHDAGRQLAKALGAFKDEDAIILALPRGGVPVAYEVARALDLPLDIALVRKIGAPGNPEVGIGAVVDGRDPQIVLNESVMALVQPSADYIAEEARKELAELERRRVLYRGHRPAPAVKGRVVILIDDGIATGSTVRAVLRGLAQAEAKTLVLAVPVAPPEAIAALRKEANEIVCLATPDPFYAVGLYYGAFDQTSDAEVIALLGGATAPENSTHRTHTRS